MEINKDDHEKEPIHLVPTEIIKAIAKVRRYGSMKYKSPDNWQKVEPYRYYNATMRHLIAWIESKGAKDEESGLSHLWHAACNIAFMIELEKQQEEHNDVSNSRLN